VSRVGSGRRARRRLHGIDSENLGERFAAGEPGALEAVFRAYGGPVNTVAMSILRDRELAAEAVQQTFVKAWRAAGSFDPRRELAPWLYSIARRTSLDVMRFEGSPTRSGHEPEVEGSVREVGFEPTWEAWEIRRALESLPAEEREVIRLTHFLGHSHREVAELTGVAVGTVKSRSHRAHRRLAEMLAHLEDPGRDSTGANSPGRSEGSK